MNQEALHRRARERGVNPFVLFMVRAILTPFFLIYLRMERIGREHIPSEGPVILASNHRSFFDPFVIGTMTRRPVYYVAKQELFGYNRLLSWLLKAKLRTFFFGWVAPAASINAPKKSQGPLQLFYKRLKLISLYWVKKKCAMVIRREERAMNLCFR